MTTRLATKAYSALKVLEQGSYSQRLRCLESCQEYGFAILLQWIRIEAALKLIRYDEKIVEGWPDKLDFIRADWKPFRPLRRDNDAIFQKVFGKTQETLYSLRNAIAHGNVTLSASEYHAISATAQWSLRLLTAQTPNTERLRRRKASTRLIL